MLGMVMLWSFERKEIIEVCFFRKHYRLSMAAVGGCEVVLGGVRMQRIEKWNEK